MINKKQFLQVLKNYNDGTATDEEIALLNAYYNLFELDPEIAELMAPADRLALKKDMQSYLFEKIGEPENKQLPRKTNYLWWSLSAASIILVLSFILYFKQGKMVQPAAQAAIDVNPGGNKAVLTLADGSKIMLDDAKNGVLVNQGNIKVSKINGEVVYISSATAKTEQKIAYNTLETPSGGQFKLVLPDGSQVWLNAKSSIRYPTVFLGNERKVEITGEAYFEIEKDKLKPFRVVANNQLTEVLGTHFNINAYADESTINTTLLEGSVKVSALKGNNMAFLKPGQQSRFLNSAEFKVLSDVDLDEAVAWKNGFFEFNGADFNAIMRQLSRWYDVDVAIPNFPQKEFDGVISRKVPLSKVLRMLELTSKLEFKIVKTNTDRRMIMLK